ncbi:MAG: DUF4080 domain-containing protein [Clostridia bacterium]|nr:DUF4080 domain-containing protein [Clostridia bacterium]
MKVVLLALNGSWSHSSLSLRCLRPPLERAGYSVELMEYTLRDRTAHILEALYNAGADVYGFSCYIWNLEPMLKLAQTLKSIRSQCCVVLGGPEVSYGVDRFDGMDWIDAILCGEAEEEFPRLCKAMEQGTPFPRVTRCTPPQSVMGGEGILYRPEESNGGILYYESSRGCPYSCAYCLSSATHGLRMKSVEQTLADLLEFEKLPGDFKVIKLVDRTFNADVGRANAIWRGLLDERYTKHYHFEICASLLNEESFDVLSMFPKGKIQLEVGLQSTHLPTLEASSRHIDPKQVIRAVKRVHDPGNIHVHLDLIAGLPFEGYERFARSFDDAYGCCDQLQLGFLKLLHGTRLREQAEEYGYRYLPYPPYTVLESKWISYEELQRLSRIAEVLERFLESGRFAHTLWLLTPHMASPFRFWEGLTDFIRASDPRPLQKLSQPEVFRALQAYAIQTLPGVDRQTLAQMLCADFSTHEHKNPPAFLRTDLKGNVNIEG